MTRDDFFWCLVAFLASVFVVVVSASLAVVMFALEARASSKVDVALVLAIDHSDSVDETEWQLQMRGYAAALRSETVAWAAFSGKHRRIAIHVFRWGGLTNQTTILPWTEIHDAAGLAQVATELESHAGVQSFSATSISGAMVFAEAMFLALPYEADRKVLDISGDGKNNAGPDPAAARKRLIDMGVTINGLPIIKEEPDVATYYETTIIGGRGAFMLTAHGHDAFAEAVQRKLELELASLSPIKGSRP